MPLKMSKQAIIELLNSNKQEYRNAKSRRAKSRLLLFLMQSTGYKSPKTIIRYYSQKTSGHKKERRGRKRKLSRKDVELLKELWFIMDQPCSKRMQAMLPEWINSYRKSKEIKEERARRLLSVSAATLDRVLKDSKVKGRTKDSNGSLSALKNSIPIIDRTREITEPGHLYADTVSHGGESSRGSYAWTLTVTDDQTLWTSNRAIWNKGREATGRAFLHLLGEMPFRIRSINTDNGAEFINWHLQTLLAESYKTCEITRSRPYKKNDNARAEERNRHKVRDLVGKERFDDERFVKILNRIYKYHNLLTNHFMASNRILEKQKREKGKVRKKYDKARTPYQRVMENIKEGRRKERLKKEHESLDPIELRNKVEEALKKLFDFAREKREKEEMLFEQLKSIG